jgi:uncharacterized protein (UPF0262 family)
MEKDNIIFFIDEADDKITDNQIASFDLRLDLDLELVFDINNEDASISQMVDYNINYTIKELFVICDYYGISKNLKASKSNKQQIIEAIFFFENALENHSIVMKRKTMWFYMDELKNDKFMRKYIMLWSK